MFAEVRLRTGTNWSNYTIITRLKDLAFDTKYQDVGSFGFTVTQDDADALGLIDDSVIEIAPNGTSKYNMWYVVDGTNGTKTADDTLWKTVSGKSLIAWLEDCKVYPSSWPTLPTVNPDGTTTPIIQGHSFQNATAGTILRTLIARGKQRGGLSWLDETSFTGTTTTDSKPWSATLTTTYSTGTTLLQVVQDLAARRLIQFRMNGLQLQVFNYDSQVSHKTPEQVTFRRGQNLLEQTTNTDSSTSASVVLIQGDQTALAEVSTLPDGSAPTITRRREMFVAQGGITDGPTLAMLGKAQLAISGHIKAEESIGVKDDLEPWTAYDVGDWVWEDVNGTNTNIQIKQISATSQDANNLKIGLTLGDLLDDQDVKMQQRIDNITGQNAGGYGALPNTIQNYLAPSPPTGVTASPTAYSDANGNDFVQVTITWSAPVTNIDGSVLVDLDRYEVQYKTGSATAWAAVANVPASATAAYISSLASGVSFTCQVRAVDTDGNASTWTALAAPIASLPHVTTPPGTPATPTATQAVRGIAVGWTGLTATGANYDARWLRTDVWLSTVSAGFVPGDSGSFVAGAFSTKGGTVNVSALSYGQNYWVKLVAVDKSGNQSTASASSAVTTAGQLSDPDLPAKLVTGAKIADGTINTNQLTVATFGPSMLPNGGFEDTSATSTVGAAHWKLSFANGTGWAASTLASGGASGTNCLKISVPVTTSGNTQWVASTDNIPTAVGDLWYVKAKVKADRAQTGAATVTLAFGQAGGAALPIILDGNNPTSTVFTVNVTTNWVEFEGQMIVPSGTTPGPLTRMAVVLIARADGATNNIYFDDVSLRPVGGSAFIKDLSVVNAKINDVSADKLTVGTLNADITVSSRIKTSDTGARVEMNSTGIQAYDPSNNQTLNVSDLDGSIVMVGTLKSGAVHGGEVVVPDATTDASAHVVLDKTGFAVNNTSTTNLVPNPNFLNLTGVSASAGVTTAYIRGPAYTDFQGNVDMVALYGNGCLKAYKTTAGAGTISIAMGNVQPGQTYTASWHTSATNINDTATLSSIKGETSLIKVTRTSDSTVLATGRDGYVMLPGTAFAGDYSGFSQRSGITDTGFGQTWQVRYNLAFTVPTGWTAGTPVTLTLPVNVNADGTANTTVAMCVSAVQLEAHPYMTRYCDGDQPGCSWDGTRGASTSTRSGQKSVWFPSNVDPYFAGKQSMPSADIRKLKLGSAATRGSNFSWQGLSTQPIPHATWTNLAFPPQLTPDRIAQDDGLIQNNGSDASQFWAWVNGFYLMNAFVVFAAGPASARALRFVRYDGTVLAQSDPCTSGTGNTGLSVAWAGTLLNAQWVRVQAYQSSGATLNVLTFGPLGGGADTAQAQTNIGWCQLG